MMSAGIIQSRARPRNSSLERACSFIAHAADPLEAPHTMSVPGTHAWTSQMRACWPVMTHLGARILSIHSVAVAHHIYDLLIAHKLKYPV